MRALKGRIEAARAELEALTGLSGARRRARRAEAKLARIRELGGLAPAKITGALLFCLGAALAFAAGALTREPGALTRGFGRGAHWRAWGALRDAVLPALREAESMMGWGLWGLCGGALIAAVVLVAGRLDWRELEPAPEAELLSLEQVAARNRSMAERLELEACAKRGSGKGGARRL